MKTWIRSADCACISLSCRRGGATSWLPPNSIPKHLWPVFIVCPSLGSSSRPIGSFTIGFAVRGRHEDTELAESKHADQTPYSTEEDQDEKEKTAFSPTLEPVKRSAWVAHIQFIALCWTLFVAGWNDATTGPLLPRMQSAYHVCSLIAAYPFNELSHFPRSRSDIQWSLSSLSPTVW